jgi:hypothetical protein
MRRIIDKFNLTQIAISTLEIVFTVTPTNALPGENVATTLKWAKTNPQLPTLEYSSETLTYSGTQGNLQFFISVVDTSDNFIYTSPNPPAWTVRSETIEVKQDSNIKFSQKTTKSIKLIQNIYNLNIANDFRNSRYVAKINGMNFYEGKLFAYITIDSSVNSSWEIIYLESLSQEIDNAKLLSN